MRTKFIANVDVLRLARERRGLSQSELARMIHCTKSTISNIEGGRRCGKKTLVRYADEMNVPMSEVLLPGKMPAVGTSPHTRAATAPVISQLLSGVELDAEGNPV